MSKEFNYFRDVMGPNADPALSRFNAAALLPAKAPKLVLEMAGQEEMTGFGEAQTKSQAMAVALVWIDEGDYTSDALGEMAAVMADLDGDEELSSEEEDFLVGMLEYVGDAFVALGADSANVQAFLDDEDDAEGEKLGSFLSGKMGDEERSDDDLIAAFAMSSEPVMEGVKKVVRNGKIKLIRTKIKRKKLTSAQRAGLKKARRKANTGAAKLARAKAMRLRKQRGL